MRQPIENMAEAVVELLKRWLEDESPMVEYRVFPGQLQTAD